MYALCDSCVAWGNIFCSIHPTGYDYPVGTGAPVGDQMAILIGDNQELDLAAVITP